NVYKSGGNAQARCKVLQKGIGASVNGAAGNDVFSGLAELQQHGSNGTHSAGSDIGSFSPFHGSKSFSKIKIGRGGVTGIMIRAFCISFESIEHGLGDRKSVV